MQFSAPKAAVNRILRRAFLFTALLFAPLPLLAEEPAFSDIPGVWYESAVKDFLAQGYLDAAQPTFRGGERANRAEFVKLIVALNGGIIEETPKQSSFEDVSTSDWFFPFFEEAAREQWIRGDGDCFGQRSCKVRPSAPVSRAEAAVLVVRAFGKKSLGTAPAFADNPPGSWFSHAIQIAADHCILRGDEGSRNVRTGDPLNRAEMVVMLSRIDEGKEYPNC